MTYQVFWKHIAKLIPELSISTMTRVDATDNASESDIRTAIINTYPNIPIMPEDIVIENYNILSENSVPENVQHKFNKMIGIAMNEYGLSENRSLIRMFATELMHKAYLYKNG